MLSEIGRRAAPLSIATVPPARRRYRHRTEPYLWVSGREMEPVTVTLSGMVLLEEMPQSELVVVSGRGGDTGPYGASSAGWSHRTPAGDQLADIEAANAGGLVVAGARVEADRAAVGAVQGSLRAGNRVVARGDVVEDARVGWAVEEAVEDGPTLPRPALGVPPSFCSTRARMPAKVGCDERGATEDIHLSVARAKETAGAGRLVRGVAWLQTRYPSCTAAALSEMSGTSREPSLGTPVPTCQAGLEK